MPPFLEFKNIRMSYDGVTDVLTNIDFDIKKGEFVSFLGPSGSGKTTLLMVLAGFESASDGDVLLDGQSILSLPPDKRNMGIVFQNYALFPHMTVAQNIGYSLKQRKWSKTAIAERVDELLDLIELPGFGDRKPNQLSGGQRQRVAVARALAFKPDVILLDEPLSALDRNLREQMQLELKQLHTRIGITFVMVTHDQDEALAMSDRIVVLDNGIIQQCATPTEIYNTPANAFVASFVGGNNCFAGVVDEKGLIVADTFQIPAPTGYVGSVEIMVRPEKTHPLLNGETVDPKRTCVVAATFLEEVFSGPQKSLVAELGSGKQLLCLVPPDFSHGFRRGQQVQFQFQIEDMQVFQTQ